MTALRVHAALLAVMVLLAGCSGSPRSSFPTEDEVRSKLHKGMTVDEVFATFGKPDGHQFIKFELGGKLHYIAPPATRAVPREGYAGFTVYFVKDQVWDWEPIVLNPSYEPRLLAASQNRWGLAFTALMFLGVAVFALLRRAWMRRQEEQL
jgi:hypothetical protein